MAGPSFFGGLGKGFGFQASMTAMAKRIIKRRHNPRTTHAGNPAIPQNAGTAARTARMRMVTAHENIFHGTSGLKRAKAGTLP